MQRLWEIKHPYHCTGGNYFTNQSTDFEFSSWKAFLEEWGDADEDYNLLFRWDWQEGEIYDLKPGEARVEIHFFLQRKGYQIQCQASVTRDDEPAVREYLAGKWAHMKRLWAPLG